MQYSRIESFTTTKAVVVRKEENINKLEVVNLINGVDISADVNGVLLYGTASPVGLHSITFYAGEGRVFNQDFIIRDYCDNLSCYLMNVLVIKTILEE